MMLRWLQILGVQKTTSQREIKKAYHKLALRLHPDKNPGDEEAKEKFQQLQKVISILEDEEKRALYDETGCFDDVVAGDDIHEVEAIDDDDAIGSSRRSWSLYPE
ncbi:unnamed protein product [Linum trigynum]|uniref:J domain-containing protein n=1 Tax=Linum trigynum TaxID=586398 RepID=A0AAV2FAF0_9ROSI